MTPLAIRPPTLADAPALLAFELENRAYFEHWIHPRDPGYYSEAGVCDAIDQADAARRDDQGYQFLAVEGERIVGRVNLSHVQRARFDCADLGYRVGERDAGRGVAGRAVTLCLREAFGPLGFWRIQATARPENRASTRVLERSGFAAFGHSRRSVQLHGQWFDLLHFERHRDPQA